MHLPSFFNSGYFGLMKTNDYYLLTYIANDTAQHIKKTSSEPFKYFQNHTITKPREREYHQVV